MMNYIINTSCDIMWSVMEHYYWAWRRL